MGTEKSRRIFYSWQSDLDRDLNQYLVRDALKAACRELSHEFDEAIRPDSGTEGVGGIEDIHVTILKKLETTDLAVFDVTPVSKTPSGKLLPNPNVMLELGFALSALGADRIALVLNASHGGQGELPFDIRNRPNIAFRCAEEAGRKSAQRDLTAKLVSALRILLSGLPEPKTEASTLEVALRQHAPDRGLQLEGFLLDKTSALLALSGNRLPSRAELVEQLAKAAPIEREILAPLSTVLRMKDDELFIEAVHRVLEKLVEACEPATDVRSRESGAKEFERVLSREVFLLLVDLCWLHRRPDVLRRLFRLDIEFKAPRRTMTSAPFQRIFITPWMVNEKLDGWRNLAALFEERTGDGGPLSNLGVERLRNAELIVYFNEVANAPRGLPIAWLPCLLPISGQVPEVLERLRSREGVLAMMAALGTNEAEVREALGRLREESFSLFRDRPWAYAAQHSWPGPEDIAAAGNR